MTFHGYQVQKTPYTERWFVDGRLAFNERNIPRQRHIKEWYFYNDAGLLTTVLDLHDNTFIEHYVYDDLNRVIEYQTADYSYVVIYFPHGKMHVHNDGAIDYLRLNDAEMSAIEFFAHVTLNAGQTLFTHKGKVYKITELEA